MSAPILRWGTASHGTNNPQAIEFSTNFWNERHDYAFCTTSLLAHLHFSFTTLSNCFYKMYRVNYECRSRYICTNGVIKSMATESPSLTVKILKCFKKRNMVEWVVAPCLVSALLQPITISRANQQPIKITNTDNPLQYIRIILKPITIVSSAPFRGEPWYCLKIPRSRTRRSRPLQGRGN